MSLLNPIISLLFTAYSHPRSILHLVNLYHLMSSLSCERTHQAEDKGFESAEAVYTYYEMVPNMYRMP